MDINVRRLRCILGWLAMLLPWLSVLFTMVFGGRGWPQSISITYYYPTAFPVFLIILGAASTVLFAYKGYEKIDDIINSIAAVFGLLILLFPTYCNGYPTAGAFNIPAEISNIIHMVAAIVFFGLLSFNSLFLFTKTSGEITKGKKIRNIIFRVCGIGMLASFVLLLIPDWPIVTWFVEMLALAFFGISWLTKANCYKWLAADK